MMKLTKKNPITSAGRLKQFLPGLALLLSLQAHAFTVSQSRVVLNGTAPVSITVKGREGEGVLLIKSRLTTQIGGKERVPGVMISPPVARLESGGENSLKIKVIDPTKFPADRESKFYLSVSGIGSTNPLSRDRAAVMGSLVLGTGHILKVLYRPSGLPPLSKATWNALQATRVPGGIKVTNPTPFWVTFGSIKVDGLPVNSLSGNPAIIPPFGHNQYGTRSVSKKILEWEIINDLGGRDAGQTNIQ